MSEPEKSLLIVKLTEAFPLDVVDQLSFHLNDTAEKLDFKCVLLPYGTDAEYHQPISALVDAIKQQTEAIQNLALSNMAIVDELAAANELDSDQGGTLDARNLSDQIL